MQTFSLFHRYAVCAFVITVICLSPTAFGVAEGHSDYERGIALLKQGKSQSAFKAFERSVKQGHTKAHYWLGEFYFKGRHVQQDYGRAFKLYQVAADKDHVLALRRLGECYINGYGIEKDVRKGMKCFVSAANMGDVQSMIEIGALCDFGDNSQRNYKVSLYYYHKAISKDSTEAMVLLGRMYDLGNGVGKDPATARKWFLRAAEKGDAFGMAHLAQQYIDGRGVKKNYAKAHEWYLKAVKKGDALAMCGLGEMYAEGLGVEKNLKTAVQWWEKSAQKGEGAAITLLGKYYLEQSGNPEDYPKGVHYYTQAATEHNIFAAKLRLGKLYLMGEKVEQDYGKAQHWLTESTKIKLSSDPEAMYLLSMMHRYGLGTPVNNETSAAWAKAYYNQSRHRNGSVLVLWEALMRNGEEDLAEHLLKRQLGSPIHSQWHRTLFYYLIGDYNAQELLDQCPPDQPSAGYPELAEAMYYIAFQTQQSGHTPKAIERYEKSLEYAADGNNFHWVVSMELARLGLLNKETKVSQAE